MLRQAIERVLPKASRSDRALLKQVRHIAHQYPSKQDDPTEQSPRAGLKSTPHSVCEGKGERSGDLSSLRSALFKEPTYVHAGEAFQSIHQLRSISGPSQHHSLSHSRHQSAWWFGQRKQGQVAPLSKESEALKAAQALVQPPPFTIRLTKTGALSFRLPASPGGADAQSKAGFYGGRVQWTGEQSTPDAAASTQEPELSKDETITNHSKHAVEVALWCNLVVLLGKLAVYWYSQSSVMLAEAVHSLADLTNQSLLAYGIARSKKAPDRHYPYGYSKERFIWALISAVGIFCCGAGVSIVHGIHCLTAPEPLDNLLYGGIVLALSAVMEGTSMVVAYRAVREGAKAEGMSMRDYLWRGHDPTAVAVFMEDGAAVAGLGIAGFCLAAVHMTGNPVWDAAGSIAVGGLLGTVAVFLIQRNRSALLGRSMDDQDTMQIMHLLKNDPVVHAIYDCKSEVIGPGEFRFKAEIDFSGPVVVRNFLKRTGRDKFLQEVEGAVGRNDEAALNAVMEQYGAQLVGSIGDEIDRLEQLIQKHLPEVRHVDIEAHSRYGRPAR